MRPAPNPAPPPPSFDRQLDAIQTALTQARITLVLLIGLLVAVGVIFIVGAAAEPSVPIDEQKLAAVAKERLKENSDEIWDAASSFVADTAKPVAKAFTEQAREDTPLYVRAVEEQSDELVNGLEEQLRQRLHAQVDDFVAKHREVFRQEFPEITDEETIDRILREYKQTTNRILERYYIDDFRRQVKRTEKLWKTFEPVEPPKKGTLEDELFEYLSDWIALKAKERTTEAVVPGTESENKKP